MGSTGHYAATDALSDYESSFTPPEWSSGRGPFNRLEEANTCLVGLRRSLASFVARRDAVRSRKAR